MTALFAAGCATTNKQAPPPAEPVPMAKPAEPAGPTKADAERALAAADSNLAAAKKSCGLWRDTAKIMDGARKAFDGGDYATAIKDANKASKQGDNCVNQSYEEAARSILGSLAPYRGGMSSSQLATLGAGEGALGNHEGKRAYDLLSGLQAEIGAEKISYTVMKGDSLWNIAGKPEIYGNPMMWPQIHKANQAQVSNPDMISPGQVLTIDRNP